MVEELDKKLNSFPGMLPQDGQHRRAIRALREVVMRNPLPQPEIQFRVERT